MTGNTTEVDHPAKTAKEIIHEIAAKHGIKPIRTELDTWAEKITELSDDDVKLDDTEMLLVWFRRNKIMDGIEITKLNARYIKERDCIL